MIPIDSNGKGERKDPKKGWNVIDYWSKKEKEIWF
jgi:hypothetical protein